MQQYEIEFTQTILVEAESEEDAVRDAIADIADEKGICSINGFWVYVNGKGYN